MVHGGIDGFSRLIVYLRCATNNLSITVEKEFLKAVDLQGLPSRLRCDRGVENVRVKEIMLQRRGEGRGSVLCGSSVHNQRIERLWKDVRRTVLQYFRNLFYFMEDCGLLDINNNLDLFCLHWTFLPRINKLLEKFKGGWNNHKLSTCHSKTPNQLFITGLLNLYGCADATAVDVFETTAVDPATFGVEDTNVAEPIDDDAVVVPEAPGPVPAMCLAALAQRRENIEQGDNNHGIQTFLTFRVIVNEYINTP